VSDLRREAKEKAKSLRKQLAVLDKLTDGASEREPDVKRKRGQRAAACAAKCQGYLCCETSDCRRNQCQRCQSNLADRLLGMSPRWPRSRDPLSIGPENDGRGRLADF
jgi:hypothetical protein